MEYTVVSSIRKDEFINEVNGMIAKGWEPLGGVAHSMVQYETVDPTTGQVSLKANPIYSQAMIKK